MGIFDLFKKKSAIINSQVSQMPNTPTKSDKTKEIVNDSEPQTLENMIKQAVPSQGGLYPHEILMLEYADTYKTDENTFQNFWKWEYSVLNPQAVLDSLYERGFICHGDAQSALKHLLVADMKAMLSKIGEKTTGKKEELINRIINAYNPDDLEKELPIRNYALTEKGESELKHNEYVSYLHRHRYMSVWEMNIKLYRNNPSNLKYRDIIWGYFNEQSGLHFKNFDFGLYRNVRLNMHDFLIEEKKFKRALQMLIEVISFDLSGLGNNDSITSKQEQQLMREIKFEGRMANLFMSEDKKEIILPPGIIKYFQKLYDELAMPTEEFIQFVYECFSKVHIFERVFNEEECANIILSEIGLEKRKITNSCKVAEERLKKQFGI